MRVVAALALLAACTDEPDPCAGITGTCVVLTVESAAPVEELQLGITIASTQSIVSRSAADATEFLVPIDVGTQPVALDIVAVARTNNTAGAAGAISVDVANATPTLLLGPVLECVEGGSYCGGDKLYGDPGILYTCRAGRVPELKEVCEDACLVADAGTDDYCKGD